MNKKSIILTTIVFCAFHFACSKSGIASEGNIKTEESKLKTILPNIFMYEDICNVYVLKSGSSALLIDAGSGKISNYLHKIGINKIDWIFQTHYHRDQCIGSPSLKNQGAQIAVGKSEVALLNWPQKNAPFKIPDTFLLNGELPNWGMRMAPFQGFDMNKELIDNEIINWNQFKITVINTPGHTKGSISYFVEVDGHRVCFSGDLIIKGGHIQNLYSMQWTYLANPGIDATLSSLQKIDKLAPEILLPSHWGVIDNPREDVYLLDNRLKKFKKAFTKKRTGRWNWSQMIQVSKHVVQDGGSTTQIIISDSGEALLFDCGKEFSLERLKKAKAKFGITKVDVIIPSHWHYDHVDGISAIAEAEEAKVWAWEGLAEYLESPQHFPTTCWTGKSIKIDRVLTEEEEFEWGGHSFKVFHHPVHTEQQMGLSAHVDGINFYLIADGTGYSKEGNIRCPIHCYNGLSLSSGLLKTAKSFYKANPYICLPAHSNVFAVGTTDRDEFLSWAIETTDVIKSLITPPFFDLGYDPYWAAFYPTRVIIKPGEKKEIALRVKNYSNKKISGHYQLKSYGDIEFEQKQIIYDLNPGEIKSFPVIVKSFKTAGKGIHIITADIKYDNQVFAEFPQAYIQINE